jgi:ribosomal protein S12
MRRIVMPNEQELRLYRPRRPESAAYRAMSKTLLTKWEIVEFDTREEMLKYVDRHDKTVAAGWRTREGGGWKFYIV